MEQNEEFPNLLHALWIVGVLFGIELVAFDAYCAWYGQFRAQSQNVAGLVLVFANGVVFTALMLFKNLSLADLFHAGRSSPRTVLLLLAPPMVLLFAGLSVLIHDLMVLVVAILPMTQSQQNESAHLMSGGLASLMLVCVVAPPIEEMLFRGIFLRSFLQQYSSRLAIIFSSAVFGIAHLNIYSALGAFIVGLILGWVYSRVRSLWPCIVGHATYNLAIFSLFTATRTSDGLEGGIDFLPLPFQVPALIGVLSGGYVLWKLLGTVRSKR